MCLLDTNTTYSLNVSTLYVVIIQRICCNLIKHARIQIGRILYIHWYVTVLLVSSVSLVCQYYW